MFLTLGAPGALQEHLGECRRTGGDVLSIWAPSVVPEGTAASFKASRAGCDELQIHIFDHSAQRIKHFATACRHQRNTLGLLVR